MAHLGLREALMILLFNLVVPSLDQYTDVTIILRLMAGPDPDTHLVTGMCSYISMSSMSMLTLFFIVLCVFTPFDCSCWFSYWIQS